MDTWIRRAHIVIMVGGGLCGLAILTQHVAEGFEANAFSVSLLVAGLALFLWAIVLGLRVSEGTTSQPPIALFYAIQIIWITTPNFQFEIGMGPLFYIGLAKWSLKTVLSFGVFFEIKFLGDMPWQFGVNVVALSLFILVVTRSMSPDNALERVRGH